MQPQHHHHIHTHARTQRRFLSFVFSWFYCCLIQSSLARCSILSFVGDLAFFSVVSLLWMFWKWSIFIVCQVVHIYVHIYVTKWPSKNGIDFFLNIRCCCCCFVHLMMMVRLVQWILIAVACHAELRFRWIYKWIKCVQNFVKLNSETTKKNYGNKWHLSLIVSLAKQYLIAHSLSDCHIELLLLSSHGICGKMNKTR